MILENIGNYTVLTDIMFVRQDAKKKGPRSTMAAELQRMPIDNSASILNSQIVRFCFFNTVVCS